MSILRLEPSLRRVTEPQANLPVPARVYDVEGGAIFAKNSTFVFSDGFAWTPRLRSPSPIMAPDAGYSVGFCGPRNGCPRPRRLPEMSAHGRFKV